MPIQELTVERVKTGLKLLQMGLASPISGYGPNLSKVLQRLARNPQLNLANPLFESEKRFGALMAQLGALTCQLFLPFVAQFTGI